MSAPVVCLSDVSVSYRGGLFRPAVEAVRNVSLEIAEGETLGLVGESGSGKSTLGRVCLGLTAPTRGRMTFAGEAFGALRARRGQLAVVLQFPEWALNPRLRCGRSIEEPLLILGVAAAERRDRVVAMLGRVGLDASVAHRDRARVDHPTSLRRFRRGRQRPRRIGPDPGAEPDP
jgi:ABC-type glutathione transport system ATPase component